MNCTNTTCDHYTECQNTQRQVFEALREDAAWLQTQYRLCEISYKHNMSWGIRSKTNYKHTPFWTERNSNEHEIKQGQDRFTTTKFDVCIGKCNISNGI